MKKTFFINTLVILITGFIIKFLGLINRIFITRLLGTEGMSLYILSFPTIMLFISISGLCLNVTISKLVSENIKTRLHSPKLLLYKSIKLSLIVSLFTIIGFLLLINPLVELWLKNEELYIPLLSVIPLIPLVGISDSLRGYLNGIKDMMKSSISTLLEQITRIVFSILFLFIFVPYGNKVATFFCLIALSMGEIASIIYCLVVLKRIGIIHYENTTNEMNAIIKVALPSTLSRLVGNFTFFLEPILFVFILTKLNYTNNIIQTTYTIINAYTISLLTLGSFVSNALSTSVIPSISENYVTGNIDKVNYYIKKTIIFSLIPGIFISIILFFYPYELMNLIYGTTEGAKEVKYFVVFFLPYYLQAPLSSIYQALGKAKSLFITSSIFNVLRLLLIVVLSYVDFINLNSLLVATFITLDIFSLIIYLKIKKLTSFKISFNYSITLLLLSIFIISIIVLFDLLNLNMFITIIVSFIVYLFVIFKTKVINLKKLND